MAKRRIKYARWGLAEDPRGYHVCMDHQGRHLLGEVKDVEARQFGASGFFLTVHHFNGEPWPIQPCAVAVEVLDRTRPEWSEWMCHTCGAMNPGSDTHCPECAAS